MFLAVQGLFMIIIDINRSPCELCHSELTQLLSVVAGEQERNASIDATKVEEAFSAGGKNLNEAISQLPAEQQKAISQLYLFLVQVASTSQTLLQALDTPD